MLHAPCPKRPADGPVLVPNRSLLTLPRFHSRQSTSNSSRLSASSRSTRDGFSLLHALELESSRIKCEGHGVAGPRSISGESLDTKSLTPAFAKDSERERKTGTQEIVQSPGSLSNRTEKSRKGHRSRRGLLRAGSGEEMDAEQV